jgi:archaellum component FlaF (FlaF/FlaG flagellin family)
MAAAGTVAAADESAAGADFSVEELSPEYATVEAGDEFTVDATLTNQGDESATQEIELLVEGRDSPVDATEVTLAPGETTTVTLDVDTTQFKPGEYRFAVFTADDSGPGTLNVTASSEANQSAPPAQQTDTVEEADELSVSLITPDSTDSFTRTVGSNAVVPVWVGATDAATTPASPVTGQNLTLSIARPDGTTKEFNLTTGGNGNDVLAYDLGTENRTDGTYTLTLRAPDSSAFATRSLEVGPSSDVTTETFRDRFYVGEQANVSVLVRNGTEAATGEEYDVTVTNQSGDEVVNRTATVNDDGFVTVRFTPQSQGSYFITGEANSTDDVFSTRIDAVRYAAEIETDTSSKLSNETVPYGGIIYDANGPAANTQVTVNITNNGEVVESFETQTDGFGTFLIQWDAPAIADEFGETYGVTAETSDGTPVTLSESSIGLEKDPYAARIIPLSNPRAGETREVRVEFRDNGKRTAGVNFTAEGAIINQTDSVVNATTNGAGVATFVINATDSGTITINATERNVQTDVFAFSGGGGGGGQIGIFVSGDSVVAPGESTSFTVESFNADPGELENKEVDITLRYEFNGPPAASKTVTFNESNLATAEFQVPENAPDGVRVSGEAVVEVNNRNVTTFVFGPTIQEYTLDYDTLGVDTAGETNTVTVEATEPNSDAPVSGVPVFLDAYYDRERAGSFTTTRAVTNDSGIATLQVDVPADATVISVRLPGKYSGPSRSRGVRIEPASVSAVPGTVAPTESTQLSFQADTDRELRGIVQTGIGRVDSDDTVRAGVVRQGENVQATVPVYARTDRFSPQVTAIDSDGRLYRATNFSGLQVQEEFTLEQIDIQHQRRGLFSTSGSTGDEPRAHAQILQVESVQDRSFEVGGQTDTGFTIRNVNTDDTVTVVPTTTEPVSIVGVDFVNLYAPSGTLRGTPNIRVDLADSFRSQRADVDVVAADPNTFNSSTFSDYEVALVDNASSTDTTETDQTGSKTVGIGYEGPLQQNSTNGTIEFTFPRDTEVDESWNVTFFLGSPFEPVVQKNLENTAGDSEFVFTVDASELPNGTYNAQIQMIPQEPNVGSTSGQIGDIILTTFNRVTIGETGIDAQFSSTPQEPALDENVTFDAGASSPGAGIDRYEWDFGDGTTATTSSPTIEHAYTSQGEYEVTLTVVDTDGDTASITQNVTVNQTVSDYANDDGVVDTTGLRGGINDWREGDTATDLLRDVIDAWRSGDSVE